MFENKSVKETLLELDVDSSVGLTNEEASKRQIKYGLNKLQEKKKKSVFALFLSEFNDPMIFILLGAALLSLVISIYQILSPNIVEKPDLMEVIADPAIILGVCVLNAIIGTIQENKAEKSLEALKKMASPTCFVKREGKVVELKAEELVPGDIVILEEGRIVPSDLRIIESYNLKTDESSLTGESLPVEKDANYTFTDPVGVGDRINCAYMSTPIVYGRGEGIVTSIGMNTETGKIAKMLSGDEREVTPLQKKLAQLSKFLGILTIIIVIVLFGLQMLNVFVINPIGGDVTPVIIEDFMFAISLAVAAIPEGLPAVVTIVLALGVQKMVKANTIVRKLPSVETLGAVSVVCSDKTGTLTQNKMTVVKAFVNNTLFEGKALLDNKNKQITFLSTGLSLCSNATVDEGVFGDPTEVALVEFANKHSLFKKKIEAAYPRIDEYPFDSVRKMMSTKHRINGKEIVFTKGAIDSILKGTVSIVDGDIVRPITMEDKTKIIAASNKMSNESLRVLALAYKESSELSETNLVFVGFVGMIDPPRPEAKDAVSIFKQAGITTVMITGDHKTTALAIAKELGIADDESQTMSGDELDKLTPEQLKEVVEHVRVFARVSPQNKCDIITAIRENGHIAAMTGDGVNDAPSLKKADIGIAMGITGTDVAKGAADMVLTDDNFASIEKAVEEGRGIYTNIKKTVLFLLGTNIAEVFTMFIIVLLSLFSFASSLPTPLVSVHILFVNLVTDSLPAVALGSDEKEKGVMNAKPREPNESLFSHGGYLTMIGYGLVITIATLLAYFLVPVIDGGAKSFEDVCMYLSDPTLIYSTIAQTCAFSVLAISELFHMLGMTSATKSFVHNFKTKNKLLWIAFAVGFALQFIVVQTPGLNSFFKCTALDIEHWLLIVGLSLLPLIVHEVVVLILHLKKNITYK